MRVLVVRNPGAGEFYQKMLTYLRQRHYQITEVKWDTPLPLRRVSFDAMVLTGSDARIHNDPEVYQANVRWVNTLARVPTLGVCFGAQCMWRALGGRICFRHFRREREWLKGVGLVQVAFTDTMVHCQDMQTHTKLYTFGNSLRGFRVGRRTGVLFHPEASSDGHVWLDQWFASLPPTITTQ